MLPVAIKFLSDVAIPLGQGQVFNATRFAKRRRLLVAIPLGQGQVFNTADGIAMWYFTRRNPFGSGTGF